MKDGFVLAEVGRNTLLVPQGGPAENLLFLNRTARFIVECLQEEITQEAILDRMAGKYAAEREDLAESLSITLDSLRSIHALND